MKKAGGIECEKQKNRWYFGTGCNVAVTLVC